ncbi:MAG: AI-2E family transporter [Proteobacteria bacterium]|nr:AI-2E family transporter [Pseudomonadota bacterium]
MAQTQQSPRLMHLIVGAAAMVFIVWGVGQAQAVIVSLLVSVFLAVLATPPVLWLERKRVPFIAAVLLVVTGLVLVLVAIGAVVGASINSFYSALPRYQARIQEQVAAFSTFLASKGIERPGALLLAYANPGVVMSRTAGLLVRLGGALSSIVLAVITTTFVLLEAKSFPVKLRAVLGDPRQSFPRFAAFVDDIERFMVIKTLISLATGTLVALWLFLLGVDFPVLWGFLAFLLNFVPSIGSTIAGLPAVVLAAFQLGLWRAVLVAAGYLVINFVLDYGVEKRLMGRKLGLSTLVVFLSLILWGSLLGPIGAVLCIPLTLTLKCACDSSESTRWIAVLLGPEQAKARLKVAAQAGRSGLGDEGDLAASAGGSAREEKGR